MEACDLTVVPKAPSQASLLSMSWGKVALGVGLLAAFGGGLLYGYAGKDDVNAMPQQAIGKPLADMVARTVASLPPPELAPIVFNGQFETNWDAANLGLAEVNPFTSQPSTADYYCLPAALPSIDVGHTLSRWGTQINQSSQSQISHWAATVTAQLGATRWPLIHETAELAKVPIVMYHDVLAEKQVFFDITPERLNADFRIIRAKGLTPVSMDQLVNHLRTGVPLPEKPVLLTFDDGYVGHYDYVYKLAKYYKYPVAFSIFTDKVDGKIIGRSTVDWSQVQEMAQDPLVTIVSHGVTHPSDLRELSDRDLSYELEVSKQRLEEKLGISIDYFTYPEGNHDDRVVDATAEAGYKAALIMDSISGQFAGDSKDLLTIERFGASRFDEVIQSAWGGPPLPGFKPALNFAAPIERLDVEIDRLPMTLISGGQPQTIHADSRYPLTEIVAQSDAVAAVDGTFFSLEFLDSNVMIGPILSQSTGEFVPGGQWDVDKIKDRPLVLLSPQGVKFVDFDPRKHNTLEGIQQEMPNVTDAFVGAGWLVRDQQAQSAETFQNLFAFEEYRFRAFWGINMQGQPVVGVTQAQIDSVGLGEALRKAGFQTAVMLDSGASTSLVYQGESLMSFESRIVPHAVVLVPQGGSGVCDQ